MSWRFKGVLVAFLAIFLVAVTAFYLSTSNSQPSTPEPVAQMRKLPRPAKRDSSYVGSQACAECHTEIFEQFSASPMGQSVASIHEAIHIEDYESNVIEPSKHRRYKITRDGQQVTHSEIMLDSNGEPFHEQTEQVSFVLGSGRRGRSYLVNRGGLLFQSPIAWYTQSERWDLSPGFTPANHPRFSRQIDDGCLYCHAGRMNHLAAPKDHYGKPIFAQESIGCERCHGPGERHVQFQSGTATASTASDPLSDHIVNPKKLDAAKRESICYQCHLLGRSVIARYGRGFFDFRPGDDLEDIFVILSREIDRDVHGTLTAINQVEQMRSSKCYQAADGALGCTSCHNPHSTVNVEQQAEHYRLRCLACHETNGCKLDLAERELAPANNSCIHCHMPTLPAGDVPHTALTDHRILRRANESDQSNERGGDQQTALTVFDQANTNLPRAAIERAKGIALMTEAWQRNDVSLATRALTHLLRVWEVPGSDVTDHLDEIDDVPFLEELGVGYMLLLDSQLAEDCWSRVLELDPQNDTALKGLAKIAEEIQDLEALGEYLDRLVELNPWSDEVFSLRVKQRFFSRDMPGAVKDAERALEINPTLVELRTWLANTYRDMGDEKRAKQQLDFLKKLETTSRVDD